MSEKIVLPADGSVQESLKQFRHPASGTGNDGNWIVFGYEGKNTLIVVAQGTGGLTSDFYSHFPSSDCRYALFRKDWKVEMANTVKFVFIDYTPESLPPMRKALLSTHKGQIKDLMKPFSINLEVSSINEISEDLVLEKIGENSGTTSKVTDKPAISYQTVDITRSTAKNNTNLVPDSVTANRPLSFVDENAIKSAIKDVRSDSNPINWCLIHYSNPTTLELCGSGSGGVEELISNLNDSEVFYGLFRVVEQFDKTQNVKFVFLKLLSSSLPPMQKAKISTQSGFIQSIFQPYHTDIDVQSVADLSVEMITDKIQRLQNTNSNVITEEQKQARAATGTKKTDDSIAVPHSIANSSIQFTDANEWKSNLADLRSGSINWLLTSFQGRDTLKVIGKGNGGVDELKSSFEDNNINFGLVRVEDVIDKSVTVKFVYIKYQPETVPAMKKSAVSTKKGLYDQVFQPFHVNFEISHPDEINEQLVMEKVQAASGSKSKISDNKK